MKEEPYKVAGRIRRSLRKVTDHYDDALIGPSGAASEIHTDAPGEPVDLARVQARHDTERDLRYWVRFILDEVNNGTITGRTIHASSVTECAGFIDTWALALVEQLPKDGANLDREMAKHGDKLEAFALGWVQRRIEVGHCPDPIMWIDDSGREAFKTCDGNLWAVIREDDNGLLPAAILCDATPNHQWSPGMWASLGKRLGTFAS